MQEILASSDAGIADWRQRLQLALGVNGQLIVDVIPQVELVIGPQPPVPELPPTEAQNRFRLVFRSLHRSASRSRAARWCCSSTTCSGPTRPAWR